MQKLSIVIVVFNKWNFTKSCLKDLSHLPSDHQIIVVDNASTDETQSKLEGSTEITYVRSATNEGFGKASNKGYKISTAPNVMFLNNDIRVKENHAGWTQPIIDLCSSGLVGPTMGLLDKELSFVKEENKLINSPYAYMSGWCLASSKENWKKVDCSDGEIFSEKYFCYFEDTDLSMRAKKVPLSFHVVDIPVVHFGKVSSKQINTYQLYSQSRKIFLEQWKGKI